MHNPYFTVLYIFPSNTHTRKHTKNAQNIKLCDCKVCWFDVCTGNYDFGFLGKRFRANFPTVSLFGVEDSTSICFTNTYTREKKLKKSNKKTSGQGTAGISESKSKNYCPCLTSMTSSNKSGGYKLTNYH